VVVPHSYPKTKPKAMNYGLQYATGEYLVIYDAEDVPESAQLKKAVLAFKKLPENVVCVQAKLNFYNPNQNLLTRLFTAEYSLWFDLVLTGLQSLNGPIPLGGTSNHFRTKDLHLLKGWDAFNVTEDCDLGLRLFKRGYRTAIVESTTLEEANSDLRNWYNQRSRWIKGYIQTYLVHMRRPGEFFDDLKRPHVITFQLNVGGKILSMFINPIMWLITIVYFVFRSQVGPFIESFFPSFILYLGVFSFVVGNFLYLYYYLIGCAKRGQFGLIKYALLVPFYWLGMSVAAWRAVYEIMVKPHYWAKTVHGLHLGGTTAEAAEEDVQEIPADAEPIEVTPIPTVVANLDIPAAEVSALVLDEPEPEETVFEFSEEVVVQAPIVQSENHSKIRERIYWLKEKVVAFRNSPLSDGTWFVASIIFANFLNFVFNAVLGRMVSLEDFSVVTLFGTMLGLLSVILSALSSAVNHKTAFLFGKGSGFDARLFTKKTFKQWFWISGIGTALWLALSPVIGRFFQINELYLVMLFAPTIVLGTVAAVATGYLRGKFLFGIVGRAIVIEAFAKLLIAAGFVAFHMPQLTSLSIPISIAVSFWASMLYAYRAMRTEEVAPVQDASAYDFPSRFFRASLLSTAAAAVFLNVDVLLVKHYLSPESAGSYSLLSLVGKMVFFFGSLLSSFITSMVSRHEGAQTNPARDFYRLFNGTVVFTAIAFFGAGIFGGFTIPLLLGESSRSIVSYLLIYTAAMSIYTLTSVLVSYHVAKKEYEFSWIALVSALVMVLGIVLSHDTIASVSKVLFVVSLLQFTVVFGWHALRKNTRFVLRTITDLFDVFVPLTKPEALSTGKRILVFNWRDTRHSYAGGAEVYIHELAKRWVDSGNQVTVFCGNDGESPRNEFIDGVQIVRRGGFYFVYVWAFLYYLFQFRGKFDVIIDCQNGIPFFTPLYAKEKVYCLMHHVHQEVFRKYLSAPLAFVARMLESKVMPIVYRDTQFITISDSSKQEIGDLGLGLAGMEIVHPGVNLQQLVPGEKYPEPLVLYLGRLKAYKSVDILLQAFQKVLQKIPNARLVVAGGGEEEQGLRDMAIDLSIGHRIMFTGKISEAEKISWLQCAWVFVNPSMMEGWGITSIEANACGVPVVASNVPGLRDSVNNPHTGYLVEHGDVDKFAARIVRLLEEDDLRAFMAKNGIEWASNFSWEASASKLLDVIYE
jgi:glycosyltransferase involved in cell wall biosynthesis/O-antigen/teichoic acid export membrane protein